ncbi:Domain of unknown function DUF4367 [Moorella glycerini]|uniref:DUF4367 domain-containing protein n=1 Tax=Neomoorella stamsii TaxID=1266720 RepID=A0A9X7J133_9FIRM|nr:MULTISPECIES: DUF4367 domain-containing protein [Moorella]PRR68835.1 hypothetical protein MOST_31170 [Moorella stamsii]CEP67456.1 Domain of unknown function DUF4367 [Moorella glycerini]
MLTDHELDKLIRTAIREEIEEQEVPPEARERVRKALGLNKLRRVKGGFRAAALVAGVTLIMVLSAYLVFPTKATAISIVLVKRLEYLVKDRLYNIAERYSAEQNPGASVPVPAPDIGKEEKVSLDEARSRLPFALLIPGYLPEGTVLTSISLSGNKPLMEVTFVYMGNTGILKIKESGISSNRGVGIGYDADDTKVKKIEVRGVEANLLSNKSGQTLLIWHEQGVTYRIEGAYTAEEIVKIANSLSAYSER